MATIRSYTDLEQAKKLAEILPKESADSHYVRSTHDFMGNPIDGKWSHPKYGNPNSQHAHYVVQNFSSYEIIPCWSLAALLGVLDRGALFKTPNGWACQSYTDIKAITSDYYSNPINACVAMIEKLHELNLL